MSQNLNNLVQNTPLAAKSLESIIRETVKDKSKAGIFNNAAQILESRLLLEFHEASRRGRAQYSRWIRESVKDNDLAKVVRQVEERCDHNSRDSRNRICDAIETKYSLSA